MYYNGTLMHYKRYFDVLERYADALYGMAYYYTWEKPQSMFCQSIDLHYLVYGLIGLIGLIDLIGLIGLIGLIDLIGLLVW